MERRPRVLVIDHGEDRLALERALAPVADVVGAGTMAEGLAAVDHYEELDLVIVSLLLPDGRGLEVASRLQKFCRAHSRAVLVLVLTNRIPEGWETSLGDLGVLLLVVKDGDGGHCLWLAVAVPQLVAWWRAHVEWIGVHVQEVAEMMGTQAVVHAVSAVGSSNADAHQVTWDKVDALKQLVLQQQPGGTGLLVRAYNQWLLIPDKGRLSILAGVSSVVGGLLSQAAEHLLKMGGGP